MNTWRFRWLRIHDWVRLLGFLLYPALKVMPIHIRPAFQDRMDVWSFGHALASALWVVFFVGMGAPTWMAWVGALVIMTAYEVLIDGFRLEDPEGASVADLGYNLLGASLTILALAAGQWFRRLPS